jgi:hypothetical protein
VTRLRDLDPGRRRLALVLAAVVAAPFVIAAFQARAGGWYPVGDDGTMLTVARQVFSSHPPLTGEVASFDRYGVHAFHPGPFVYYVLAPFVAVFGNTLGLLLGAAFVSAGSMVLIGYVAFRTAGPAAALWAWGTAFLLLWSIGGTAFVYRPFKTISAVLVILLFLHLSTALVVGRPGFLPLWVVAGSYPVAASVRYVVPIAGVAAVTVLAVLVRRWRARNWSLDRRGRSSVAVAALLVVLAWWAPVYDALVHDGGNLRQLYRGVRAADAATDGFGVAVGELARASLFDPVTTVADHAAASWGYVVVLCLVLAAVVVVLALRRRPVGRFAASCALIAATASAGMLVVLATTPSDEGIGVFRVLGASPIGAFVVFAAGVAVAVAVRIPARAERAWPVALGGLGLVVVATTVPGPIRADSEDYPWAFDATEQLVDAAAPHLQAKGLWRFTFAGGRSTPTIFVGFKAGLDAEGVDTGLDAGAPGLGDVDDADTPAAGEVLLMPSFLAGPQEGWEAIARYEPAGRSEAAADAVAEELVAFARETQPTALPSLAYGITSFLCPELAAEPQGFDPAGCPEVQERASDANPLAELDPGVVALVYLAQFGEFTAVPLIEGARPPQDLLDEAARLWDDVPLTVYAHTVAA